MREDERESLFKALNDVKNLMQEDEADSFQQSASNKFAPSSKDEILELSGLEIHEFDLGNTEIAPDQFIMEETLLEPEVYIQEIEPEDDYSPNISNKVLQEPMGEDEVRLEEQLDANEIIGDFFNKKDFGKIQDNDVNFADIVREVAKPHIANWLNANLEGIVREVVESEIAKIMKKAKK